MTGKGDYPSLALPGAGREGNGYGRFPEVAGDPRVCTHHWRISSDGVAVCSLCEEKRVFERPGFGERRLDGATSRRERKSVVGKPRGLVIPGIRAWVEG